ncbi:MAG: hypothetical protein R6V57_06430 [Vicinamibacterales bacterium]
MTFRRRSCCTAAAALALAATACGNQYEGGGELHAKQVVLRREVQGLRAAAARLERGQPMLPEGDVAVAIDDALLEDILSAQLPFDADVDRYHLSLKEAEVQFSGSPVVRLRGTLNLLAYPSILAQVIVVGALEHIDVDPATSTLKARMAIDHLGIEKAGGLEAYVSGPALDEVGRMIRLRIKDQLPLVQIPVNVHRTIDLPAVTRGPVRIDGARLPLNVAVSEVVAARGTLWIAVRLEPGAIVKTADAPEAGATTAEEAGVSLAEDVPARTPATAPGKEP